MNFEFILYQLNADISDCKHNIQYISSDNGVDLYRAKEGFIKQLLSIPVIMTNLYFFEGNLITAYIHLDENADNIEQVSKILEHSIKRPGKALKSHTGTGYIWKAETSTLALIQDMGRGRLYVYHSLKKFDVFDAIG